MTNLSYYFLVLDIETSTLYDDDGVTPKAVWLAYGYLKFYDINFNTIKKWYFREWNELEETLAKVSLKYNGYKILCFAHNLGFEFDFLIKNISLPKQILSNSTHNIISGVLENYPNIEFRCSYQLTNYSLSKLGDMVNLPKLESDYRCIYPQDEVTEEEKYYCERDVDIVAKYVVEVLLPEYKKLFDIPFTKTGRVRKTFNDFYKQYCNNPRWDLMPDENCYQAMLDSFMGGITISNPLFTDMELKNVHSYDITSSYPYAMLKEKFPTTIMRLETFDNSYINKCDFWIAKIKFKNINSKYLWQWLSISKLNDFSADCRFFNGKLIHGKEVIKTLTNIDFELLCQTYDFDEFEVLEFYPLLEADYLPKPYIETIKYYSQKKYTLKNELKKYDENDEKRQEMEREYMLSKNDFNSIYGMSVQKLMTPEYYVDEKFQWHEKKKPYKKDSKKHMKRNFLFGIFITAYARRNLIRAIIKNCPLTFVYCDTDSIKFIGKNDFIDTNERLQEPYINIPSLSKLGTFDYETTYEEFKTFGAKKYCYKHGNEYKLVVAGLPKIKKDGSGYDIKSLSDFYCGKLFENCKLGKKYITDKCSFDLEQDEFVCNMQYENNEEFFEKYSILSNGGVALYPTSYLLDMTKQDKFQIAEMQKGFSKWVKSYKQQIGIDLTEYCNIPPHIM